MSDIGSDSDVTIADDVEEEDSSDSSSSHSDRTTEVERLACTASLQKGQKALFEKLEKLTVETTTVQYGIYDVCVCVTGKSCDINHVILYCCNTVARGKKVYGYYSVIKHAWLRQIIGCNFFTDLLTHF